MAARDPEPIVLEIQRTAGLTETPGEPILHGQVARADGTPWRTWSSGAMAATFFDRGVEWLGKEVREGRIPQELLPPTALTAGKDEDGKPLHGARRWTLPHVERVAFALWQNKKHFGAEDLLRTLDVVYAVARLQGLLPPR